MLERMGEGAALLIGASPELRIGVDGDVRYTPDAELFWLTGWQEPGAVLVLSNDVAEGRFILFVQARDAAKELWTGRRGGVEAASDQFGADAAFGVDELGVRLPAMLRDVDVLYARFQSGRPELDSVVLHLLQSARRTRPRRGRGVHTIVDPGVVLDPMRRTKDAHEIALMRRAAAISTDAFRDVARRIRAGVGEWEIEAAMDHGFRARGAWGPAFPTIVAAGASAATLHYTANDQRLRDGQLVLIDAGARAAMYCADITRTFPVARAFGEEQRRLYETVLRAHDAAIAVVAPGATMADVENAARRELVAGLTELGYIEDEPDALPGEEAALARYAPHRASHWLGLDVHDVGAYVERAAPTALEPGMVLTIEPGLYIASDADAGPPGLRGTGVRIEDDVLVTSEGCDVLTAALPADIEGILSLMD